jgi:hypothetical protein
VDPVPDPLLLRKSGSAGNRSRDLWVNNQQLWPLDHKGGGANGNGWYYSEHGSNSTQVWDWYTSTSRMFFRVIGTVAVTATATATVTSSKYSDHRSPYLLWRFIAYSSAIRLNGNSSVGRKKVSQSLASENVISKKIYVIPSKFYLIPDKRIILRFPYSLLYTL